MRLSILLLFLSLQGIYAQTKLSYSELEAKLNYFNTLQTWDSIIVIGKQAIKDDNRYFGLYHRIGKAYFYKKDYTAASFYLEKARELNSADVPNLEYLYGAYTWLGNSEAADLVAQKIPKELRKDAGIIAQQSGLTSVFVEGGQKNSSMLDSVGNFTYFGASVTTKFRIPLYLTFGYSFNHQVLNGKDPLNIPIAQTNFQHNFLANINYTLSKGVSLKGSLHYLTLSPTLASTSTTQSGYTPPLQNAMTYYGGVNLRYAGLTLQPSFGYTELKTDVTVPRFSSGRPSPNDVTTVPLYGQYWQYGADLKYILPFGNRNFVVHGSFFQLNNADQQLSVTRQGQQVITKTTNTTLPDTYYFKAGLTWQIDPKLWWRNEYYKGDAYMQNENDVTLLNNAPQVTLQRLTSTIGYAATPKLNLFLTYQNEAKANYTPNNPTLNPKFYYNSLFLGAKYDF